MTNPEPTCPHCRERMIEGFVLDHGDHNKARVANWVEGAPEKSFWTGIKVKDKETYSIRSFRCPRCGWLVNFAL